MDTKPVTKPADEAKASESPRPRIQADPGGEYFDAFASDYETIIDSNLAITGETAAAFTMRRMHHLRRRLPLLPTRVMDFGCGVGLAMPCLLEAFPGCRVVGVDVSPESVRLARERHRLDDRIQVSQLADLKSGDFDLVYSSGVFHHIPTDERPGAVAFIRDTLRPGGVVAIAEHNPWNPATRYLVRTCPFDEDVSLLRPGQTAALLRGAGFEIVATDYMSFFPGMLRPLIRMEPSLRRIPLGAQYMVIGREAG